MSMSIFSTSYPLWKTEWGHEWVKVEVQSKMIFFFFSEILQPPSNQDRESCRELSMETYLEDNAPRRVAFLAWGAINECTLTIDDLIKRGRIFVNGCYLCKSNTELKTTFFFGVLFHFGWSMAYNLLGIHWVLVGTAKEEMQARRGIKGVKYHDVGFILLATLSIIWKKRNRKAFEGNLMVIRRRAIEGM